MATVNKRLQDEAIAHAIDLSRYSNRQTREIVSLLNRVDADLSAQIAEAATQAMRSRLESMLASIRAINARAFESVSAAIRRMVEVLSGYEATREVAMIRAALPKPILAVVSLSEAGPTQVAAAALARPMQGKLMHEWLSEVEAARAKRVRDAVRIGVAEGQTSDQIVRAIRGTRAAHYGDGLLERSRKDVAALVQTAVAHVAQVAKQETMDANKDVIQGVQWVATLDDRTCIACASKDGKVYPVDGGPRPPGHVNCLPGDARVLSRSGIAAVSERWFDGEVIVIRTASGRELTCTPNHPVLTSGGWVAAQLLDCGGDVICDGGREWAALSDRNDQDVPPSIEQVRQAFLRSGNVSAVPVPVSAPDFHNDGRGSQVAVVWANRELRDGVDAARTQHAGKLHLVGRRVRSSALARYRAVRKLVVACAAARAGFMGLRGLVGALLRRHARPLESFRVMAITMLDSVSAQVAVDHVPAYAYALADGVHAVTGLEGSDDAGESGVHSCALRDGLVAKHAGDDFIGDAVLAREIRDGRSGPVFADQIVSVRVKKFRGHVYNLQTGNGFYAANGIVTHNCRCVAVPTLRPWSDFGLKDPSPATRASMDGQVPQTLNYAEWLAEQPIERVTEILGPTRTALYRKGGMKLSSFVNDQGRSYTLDQLKARDAAAFKRAGL